MRIRGDGAETEAWTLNISRGGMRVVVEDAIAVGASYEVTVGDGPARPVRVVWVREEPDGQIAGLQFIDIEQDGRPSSFPPSR